MINIAVRKLDPKNCEACFVCSRKAWGASCTTTCSANEEVTYSCPFCGWTSTHLGARYAMRPLTCKVCFKDLSMLDRMMDVLNRRLRIEYHIQDVKINT